MLCQGHGQRADFKTRDAPSALLEELCARNQMQRPIYEVFPEGIQPCNMKNRDIY